MFKKSLGAALVFALTASSAAYAQDSASDRVSFTAGLTVVSDYLFRGISQTDEGPAAQFTGEAAFKINDSFTGYVGVFASNVEFVPEPAVSKANYELDILTGLRGTIDSFGWDVKAIAYEYPSADSTLNYDFVEVGASVNYDFGLAIPTIGLLHSPNYFGNSGKATYYFADLKIPLPFVPFDTRILAHVGKQNIKKNATFDTPDYKDWNIGVFATFFGFDVGIQYADTDLKESECFPASAPHARDLCDARAVFSIGRTFTF